MCARTRLWTVSIAIFVVALLVLPLALTGCDGGAGVKIRVTITAPQAGATVGGTAVHVCAEVTVKATHTITRVDFYVDNQAAPFGSATAAPFCADWDSTTVADGDHELWAVAFDDSGRHATSRRITVTVNNAGFVGITSPTAGSEVCVELTVAADALPPAGQTITQVEFLLDGASLGTDATAPYEIQWDPATAAEGSHELTAVATTDAAPPDNTITSAPVSVTVVRLQVAITEPADGATVGGTVNVVAVPNAPPCCVSKVEFYVDGELQSTVDSPGPYTFAWDTSGEDEAAHTLKAIAYDCKTPAGTAEDEITVNVTHVVTCSIAWSGATPAPGSAVSGPVPLEVAPNASTGETITQVQFKLDGTVLATLTAPPWVFEWHTLDAGVANGNQDLTATVTDSSACTATTPVRTLDVQNGRSLWIPRNLTAAAGGTIDVPIKTNDAAGVAGLQVRVEFNDTVLTPQDPPAVDGSLLAGLGWLAIQNVIGNAVAVTRTSPTLTALTGGSGPYVVLKFDVAPGAASGATSDLQFTQHLLFDETSAQITNDAFDGLLTVE